MDYNQVHLKPVLDLEEELDVLEAVWKVGRDKGLDLLRPEQVKKLVDAGRILAVVEENEEVSEYMSKEDAVKSAFRIVSSILKSMEKYIHSDNQESMKEQREVLFEKIFGMSSKDFGFTIFCDLVGA